MSFQYTHVHRQHLYEFEMKAKLLEAFVIQFSTLHINDFIYMQKSIICEMHYIL